VHDHLAETEAHAIALSSESLAEFLKTNQDAWVDFFAPWCVWCQRLSPTWELFARKVSEKNINLGVGKVDCVAHAQLCKDERILAFPTLRWYNHEKAVLPDYKGDRTVEAFMDYANNKAGEGHHDADDDDEEHGEWHHPGCMITGRVMVNRVPGNVHIQAKSIHHEIHSAMTNLTHRVNDLSFGQASGPPGHIMHNYPQIQSIPEKFRKYTNPLHDKHFPTYEYHQAFHHHLKVITTHLDSLGGFFSQESVLYQILEQSQLVLYTEVNVPEVRFLFDLSPMGVYITNEGRRWYEYLTTLLAIIGGTYTTLGLINATLLNIFKPKKL
jgi:thiol-disulfide isomerase/thioredoxin